mmetsp:Transcript_93193/g.299985  ORF Transcript_93193/g.299985 Transcript_93193/m.299985 type:complete len:211 (-) Transcript_93193:11-643(-)
MLNAFDEEEAKKTDSSNPGLTRTQLVESMRRPFQALGYSAFCATIARHLHVLAGGKDARHGGIIESFRAVSADSTGSIQKEALARILPLGVAYLDEVSSAMCTSSDGLIRLEGFVNWAYADRGADERHRILIPKSGKLIAPSAVTGRRSASRGPGGEARKCRPHHELTNVRLPSRVGFSFGCSEGGDGSGSCSGIDNIGVFHWWGNHWRL